MRQWAERGIKMQSGKTGNYEKWHKLPSRIWRQKLLLSMIVPGIIWLGIFCYYPLYGLIIAFKNYNVGVGIMGSPWVGLKHFREVFGDPFFLSAFRNTVFISFLKLLCGFPVPIIFALILNELHGAVPFKKTVQTLSYMPHFLSWAYVSGFIISFFSDTGIYNSLLSALGLIEKPTSVLTRQGGFLSVIVLSDIWKSFGYNSIIYLAAITSIDTEQFEAACIDGASRFQQIWHITLPGIRPTIVILLILAISRLANGNFEQMYLLINDLVRDRAEIIDTYTYDIGIRASRFSYSTAVGMFTSVISFILLFTANGISRRLTESSLF